MLGHIDFALNFDKVIDDFEDAVDKKVKERYHKFHLNRQQLDSILKEKDLLNDRNLKCYLACLYIHINIVNKSFNRLTENAKKYYEADKSTADLIYNKCKDLKGEDNCDKVFNAANCARQILRTLISKASVYINVVVCIVYLFLLGFNLYNSIATNPSVTLKTTHTIKASVSALLVLTAWVCSTRYQKKSTSIIVRLLNIEKDLQKLSISADFDRIRKRVYVEIAIRLIGYVLMSFLDILMRQYENDVQSIVFKIVEKLFLKIALFINTIVHLEVITFVKIIKNNMKCLNKQLSALETINNGFIIDNIKIIKLRTHLGNKLKTLRIICPLHHELCKISYMINERYGVVLLMSFLNTFIYAVVNLYLCNIVWKSIDLIYKEKLIIYLILECGAYLTETIFTCHICNCAVEESNKSASIIHKIDTDSNTIKDQIAMFSLQIAQKRMEYNAAGLFAVNYSLIFSIIGGVTANLVILIQFSAT
ncbi:hypothetical protein FQA39_LY10785 [Lamprigera yunnana]|nr:hypothetical protein FQA39_LY10785 [Lamprigera yunnana]